MAAKTQTPAARITATARADIKAAQKAGKLTLPDGAKIRVRSHTFAGGYAVGIAVDNVDQAWAFTTEAGPHGARLVRTPAGRKLGDKLTDILAKASDGHCWGDVTIAGHAVDQGRVSPATWRRGQD